jgi:anti-sigma B factor antagonist
MVEPTHGGLANGTIQVVVTPAEIDITNADVLQAEILAASRDQATIIVDMSRTVFCDSRGMNTLVWAYRRARAGGGDFMLAGVSAPVERVMTVLGVNGLLAIHATVADAIRDQRNGAGGGEAHDGVEVDNAAG